MLCWMLHIFFILSSLAIAVEQIKIRKFDEKTELFVQRLLLRFPKVLLYFQENLGERTKCVPCFLSQRIVAVNYFLLQPFQPLWPIFLSPFTCILALSLLYRTLLEPLHCHWIVLADRMLDPGNFH